MGGGDFTVYHVQVAEGRPWNESFKHQKRLSLKLQQRKMWLDQSKEFLNQMKP